jgi:hypothetical protein
MEARVLEVKLTVTQLVNIRIATLWTQNVITVFRRYFHWISFQVILIQSTLLNLTCLNPILILLHHLYLCFLNGIVIIFYINAVFIYHVKVRNILRLSYTPSIEHPGNILWRVQIVKFFRLYFLNPITYCLLLWQTKPYTNTKRGITYTVETVNVSTELVNEGMLHISQFLQQNC